MATQHGYGQLAGTESLVFTYDTIDTTNSYKGEPTTNLTTDTPSLSGWMGGYTVENSSTKTFLLTTRQDNAATTSAWRTTYWSVSAYIGSYVTISADVQFVSETNCTFSSIAIGQGNTGSFPFHIEGSNALDKVSVYTKPVNRIHMTWSGIINSTGIVGFTQWINNVTANGANAVLRVINVQIEAKSHSTPFVNGTRSSTQGLLDLTGNSTIDLTNVSFDNNAQMTFDGTNDYITLADGSKWFTNQWSYEMVLKFNGNTGTYQGLLWGEGAVGGGSGYQKLLTFYNYSYFHYRVYNTVTGWAQTDFTPTGFTPASYNHLVWQFNNGTTQIFINGILVHTNAVRGAYSGGTNSALYIGTRNDLAYDFNGEMPVLKRYSRTLTSEEVLQNFKKYQTRFGMS